MTLDELFERLKGFEWKDIEFKEARWAVPKSAYETVSAFANTAGGHLIFGVAEQDKGKFEIVGVIEVDKVQNDFMTALRAGGRKFNRPIDCQEDMHQVEDKRLLVFYIPEAHWQNKPIYLDNDIHQTYVRRAGGDYRCSLTEIEQFLRDASTERYDRQVVPLNSNNCFDLPSVQWYRAQFYRLHPGDQSLSALEFLQSEGLLVEENDQLKPTRAGVLLFGTQAAMNRILPRPVVDCQWHAIPYEDHMLAERWSDRLVAESNLIQTWRSLLGFYLKQAERPFSIDPDTLQRSDEPPDYPVFREAAVNLLIHQDYGNHGRTPQIYFYRDRTVLSNPGDAFDSQTDLLKPGGKEVRNPNLVTAFRRIGLSEQAGTGIPSIFSNSSLLGRIPPLLNNDKAAKIFELTLLKELLLSEEQLLFQASLGVQLSEEEAAIFALACRRDHIRLPDVQLVIRANKTKAQTILDRLRLQALLEDVQLGSQTYYQVVARFKTILREQLSVTPVTLEVIASTAPVAHLTDMQWQIIMFCDLPRSIREIKDHLDVKKFSKSELLDPLMSGGLLQLQYPDKPDHRNQRYSLTQSGVRLKASRYITPPAPDEADA